MKNPKERHPLTCELRLTASRPFWQMIIEIDSGGSVHTFHVKRDMKTKHFHLFNPKGKDPTTARMDVLLSTFKDLSGKQTPIYGDGHSRCSPRPLPADIARQKLDL